MFVIYDLETCFMLCTFFKKTLGEGPNRNVMRYKLGRHGPGLDPCAPGLNPHPIALCPLPATGVNRALLIQIHSAGTYVSFPAQPYISVEAQGFV